MDPAHCRHNMNLGWQQANDARTATTMQEEHSCWAPNGFCSSYMLHDTVARLSCCVGPSSQSTGPTGST